jgi:hypothetical protein
MATLKTDWVNLGAQLVPGQTLVVKLDAWRQTFYFWSLNRVDRILLINNLPLSVFAHDHDVVPSGNHGNGPLVLDLGGAHYKGRPIQMDDQVTFYCDRLERTDQFGFLMIKQYFVEDRPGPDRQIGDRDPDAPVLPRKAVSRPTIIRPTAPVRPVFTTRKPTRER